MPCMNMKAAARLIQKARQAKTTEDRKKIDAELADLGEDICQETRAKIEELLYAHV